jgi:cobalamin biosynthetic protein CobC
LLEHGGNVDEAVRRFGVAHADWLDLSTGISPHAYPVPPVSADAWHRLPGENAALLAAAGNYYGQAAPLVVAGSQAALQALPRLRARGRVGVLAPSYSEHAQAWRGRGHAVVALAAPDLAARLDDLDVLVLVNPNNPTGERFAPETLLGWHARLAARGGWLVVDEAFMDATPADTIVHATGRDGLIVLRSLGKFFGLAGARVGFVLASAALRQALADELGPWPVAGPALFAAHAALADLDWQRQTRARLVAESTRLGALLTAAGLPASGATALFQWVPTARAAVLHRALARRAILTRLFREPASLRFGLPGTESGWLRLHDALSEVVR